MPMTTRTGPTPGSTARGRAGQHGVLVRDPVRLPALVDRLPSVQILGKRSDVSPSEPFLLFLLPGIALSSWVTRTPDVHDQLGLSTGQMGLVLVGLSVGSMIGILCSGRFVSRFGTRPVIAFDALLIIAGTAVIGVGSAVQSASLATAGLCLFGAGGARWRSTWTAPTWSASPGPRAATLNTYSLSPSRPLAVFSNPCGQPASRTRPGWTGTIAAEPVVPAQERLEPARSRFTFQRPEAPPRCSGRSLCGGFRSRYIRRPDGGIGSPPLARKASSQPTTR